MCFPHRSSLWGENVCVFASFVGCWRVDVNKDGRSLRKWRKCGYVSGGLRRQKHEEIYKYVGERLQWVEGFAGLRGRFAPNRPCFSERTVEIVFRRSSPSLTARKTARFGTKQHSSVFILTGRINWLSLRYLCWCLIKSYLLKHFFCDPELAFNTTHFRKLTLLIFTRENKFSKLSLVLRTRENLKIYSHSWKLIVNFLKWVVLYILTS